MGNYYRLHFDGEVIGTRMHAAVCLVATFGAYQSKNDLATTVGPNGSSDFGYRIVNRCLRKDLLAVEADHPDANPHGQGAVVLTEKGLRYLDEYSDKEVAGLEPVTVTR